MTHPRRRLATVLSLVLAGPAAAQATLFDVSGAVGDVYGQVCDVVGDTNGDGLGEFLVGAWLDDPNGNTDAGSVFLYSGADGLLLATLPGTGTGDHMGFGSSAAGDLNGDGFQDICAAADEDDVPGVGTNAGSARIVSGIDLSTLYTFTGEDQGDLFGWSTAAVGDVNGDGRDDVCIGALLAESGTSPGNAGSITVFSGVDGSVIHRIFGDVAGGSLGGNVGRAGDVNADGFADLIATQGNEVRVFSGLDGSELWRRTASGAGLKVSGGVDTNADGFDDFLIASRSPMSNRGRLQVISGFDNSVLMLVFGDNTGDQLGAGVAGAGDLDGDGHGDVVVGMPGFDGPAGTGTGAIRAYSGRTGGVIFDLPGDAMGDRIGTDVGAGRDVNGDGIPDVVASSTDSGKAKVVSFVPDGLEPFGTGTPGCDGPLPLLANGVPSLGNAGFELHSAAHDAGGPALLVIADAEDVSGSLFFNVLLHVDPTPPAPQTGVITTLLLGTADAAGSVHLPFPIPNNPALLGPTYAFQVVTAFPLVTCGQRLASSRGLRVTLQ